MRISGIDWDDGNWPKCGKHGVGRAEIEHVLSNAPWILPDRSPQDRETRFNAVGRNAEARHVFIVFTMRRRGGEIWLRPISARYMHRKEVESFERQVGRQA